MNTMKCVNVKKSIEQSRAAYIGHHDDFVRRKVEADHGCIESAGDMLMGAARTIDGRPVLV
jgi:hypothetical protein